MECKKSNPKREIVKNIFKAIGYFLIYFLIAQIVSFVYSIIYTIIYMINLGTDTILSISQDNSQMTMMIQTIIVELMQKQSIMILISGVLTLLTLFIIFKARKRDIKEQLSIKRIDKKAILPIVLMGLALNVITSALFYIVPEELIFEYNDMVSYIFSGNIIISFIAVAIIAPVVEEIIFRGLIFKKLNNAMHIVPAVILSSLIFAIMHGQIVWIIYAFILGVILTLIFIKFKSILANIILHISYNLLPFILLAFSAHTANISIGIILGAVILVITSMIYLLKFTTESVET